jgi:SAM-dependent methyltransferase
VTSLFAVVVGLGAFLLFQVQLVLGKQLLPWFGGTSAVWTTCLLFFQAALLAGYAWAHLVVGRLSARRQGDVHLSLVGLAVALVAWRAFAWPSPITPGEWARPSSPEAPIRAILGLLGSTVGLPFVVLAATSPLLQAWFARLKPGASPFWLFALSNAGSLTGLLSYPLLVEPLASVRAQGWLWSLAFAGYAVGVASCAVAAGRDKRPAGLADPSGPGQPKSLGMTGLWMALAFFPSVMLAAVTSHLTQEVAAVPLLWMVPLALYLLSFILSFAWPDAPRPTWRVALAAATALAAFGLQGAQGWAATPRVSLWCAILFVYGMAGHGELARLRPTPERLTGYYLAIATGGALGGLLNAVVAPLVFTGYWELHLGILAGPVAVIVASAIADPLSPNGGSSPDSDGAPREDRTAAGARQLRMGAILATALLGVTLAVDVVGEREGVEVATRGFYGVLRVVREEAGEPDELLKLLHGRICHGTQLASPRRRAEATTYFGPTSGVGLALRLHPRRVAGRPMRVGVIGLGVGTLAAWSRPGDAFRFYELDPAVARLSAGTEPVFTYLRDAAGEVTVALGDGRLVLEREPPQAYDVLVVDAFSSDAIPTHLLTREAFAAYLRHLAPGGVLAVHVTNRYVDLKPVVRGAARALGLEAEHVPSFENGTGWSSDWMLVARDRALLDEEVVSAATLPPQGRADETHWTDDWSNLLRVLKR